MNAVILVSMGELVDKITICEIKRARIKDKNKLQNVTKELKLLQASLSVTLKEKPKVRKDVMRLKKKLHAINTRLWNIENSIRKLESSKDFGRKFIELARKVYLTNDKRSAVKNEINKLFGSSINEVKEYAKY